jgi:hypothetical protein
MTCMSSERMEIRDQIAEFKEHLQEESYRWQHSSDAEREQLMQLRTLGLSEREAVEYTLMLSRDEELQRLQSGAREHVHEEGVFDSDESSGRHAGSDSSSPLSSSPTDYYSPPPPLRTSTSGSSSSSYGRFASPSTSNTKVQVLPCFDPEPKEAGGLVGSLSDSQSVLPQASPSSSPSRSYSQPLLGQASLRPTPTGDGATFLGKQNAWSKPLPGIGSAASTAALIRLPPSSPYRTNREAEAERIRRVEDLELRFALELSLAEARSRESTKNAGDM